MQILTPWHIYQIQTAQTPIHGVKLRGRIRKLGIERGINVLCENATDVPNCVRFAVINHDDAQAIAAYLHTIISDAHVDCVLTEVVNPVLSKLKVNQQERYTV